MREIIEKYYRQEHSALSEEDIEDQNCIHTPDEMIEFALSVVKNCSIPDVSVSDFPNAYEGELNTKRIAAYTKLKEEYKLNKGTVRDIFNAGADWYKKVITHSR